MDGTGTLCASGMAFQKEQGHDNNEINSGRVYTMAEMVKAYHLNVEDYLVFLLRARPSKDMTDEELAGLTPWSETAHANCAPAFA